MLTGALELQSLLVCVGSGRGGGAWHPGLCLEGARQVCFGLKSQGASSDLGRSGSG